MVERHNSFYKSPHGAFGRSHHGVRGVEPTLWASGGEHWYGRSAVDGGLSWQLNKNTPVRGVAISTDDRLYHCGNKINGNSLFRVHQHSGRTLWSLAVMAVCFRIAALGNAVYVVGNISSVGGDDTSLVKVVDNDTSGAIAWKANTGRAARGIAIYVSGGDIVTSFESDTLGRFFIRRYTSGGAEVWTTDEEEPFLSINGIAISQQSGASYAAHTHVDVFGSERSLTKISSAGEEVWGFDSGGSLNTVVADEVGNVYTGGDRQGGKSIWKVAEGTGNVVWSKDVGAFCNNIDVDDDGFVYLTNGAENQIMQLDPSDGTLLWLEDTLRFAGGVAVRSLSA